ncbi:cell division protein FtsW [Sporomusaceae bacterium BoRhaA]|uniref:FtsW/RodA/SpoVE family cell cycle protein n=1 Tax=Pelorhabdus rhamnosifermentans TaxID=2772457 RepID=UPI001C060EB1|nr:putative peptidoglycan glycosyltransferase FtsW [Pelorhabdus rhamnosifermentans]MBU2700557.1 cell division protein FtsW [Pelorhabdus rhamnosifermentans]
MVKTIPRFWKNPIEALLVITFLLIMFGVINVFSASFVVAGQQYHDSYFYVKRHLMVLVLGLIGLYVCAKLDYHRLKGRPLVYLMFGTLIVLLLVPHIGLDANGAKRWIRLGGINFQPSEVAKLTVVLLSAAYLGPKLDGKRAISLLSTPVFVSCALGFLVLKQPDMGTATVIVGLCLILYILAGIPHDQTIGLCVFFAALCLYLVYAATYRAERIAAWIDPWAYQQGIGYQAVQSQLAIGSGGLLGTGLGLGSSKFYYLPEAHTDFAFAVLSQEMGFVGAVLVLLLFTAIGAYGVRIALKAPDGFGMVLGMGLTLLVAGQAIANIAMVAGLIPVTGVPLPFISYGGTSLVVNLTAIGIMINIGRRGLGKQVSEDKSFPASPQKHRLKLIRR